MKIRSPFRNVADRHKSPTPDKYKGRKQNEKNPAIVIGTRLIIWDSYY